jgi:hypothetical protein
MKAQSLIAAIYVDERGHYLNAPGVDPWPKSRDARLYRGPHPVVAHPPCQLWVNFASLNYKRWGGEHNRPGNDGGCFAHALSCVERFGGVLEHPAGSNAWREFGLPPPKKVGWYTYDSRRWVCEVWQSAYGHRARKRTWLYYCGKTPEDADWRRLPGTHQIGWFDRSKPTLSKREASLTPLPFAQFLIGLASNAI